MKTLICLTILITGTLAVLPSYEEALEDTQQLLKLFRAHNKGNGKLFSSSELPTRMSLFRGALNKIVEINSQDLGWTAKLTPFASMTDAEKAQYLGLNASNIDAPAPESAAPAPTKRLSSVDWVARGAVSPVRSQLGGTCWSYSTIHPLEGAYAVTTGRLVEFSPQILIDCVYPGASIMRGGFPSEATNWIQKTQVIPGWNDYRPVNSVNRCNTNRPNKMTGARVTGYESIGQSSQALQNALSISPVSVLYHATKNYYYYGNGVYNDRNCRSSIYNLNHAVTAVGYTSTTFKIKNSWGTSWGNSGYGSWRRQGDCGLLLRNIRIKMARRQEEEKEE